MGLAGFMLQEQDAVICSLKSEIPDYCELSYNELRTACKENGIKTERTPTAEDMLELLESTKQDAVLKLLKQLQEFGRITEYNKVKEKY